MPPTDARLSPAALGARVKAARLAVGLTQAEAAERLGITQASYAQRESPPKGRQGTLSYGALVEMCEVLGYDPAILCPEVAPKKRSRPAGTSRS